MAFLDDVLRRVPVDRITTEARQVHFWRSVLVVLAGALFAVGWLAAKSFAVLWLACVWTFMAVRVGWQEGRKSSVPSRR